jgi:hypothetical protein
MMMKGPFRELLPVGEQTVILRLPTGAKVRRVHLLAADKTPRTRLRGQSLTVVVPSVLDHEVVAVDWPTQPARAAHPPRPVPMPCSRRSHSTPGSPSASYTRLLAWSTALACNQRAHERQGHSAMLRKRSAAGARVLVPRYGRRHEQTSGEVCPGLVRPADRRAWRP